MKKYEPEKIDASKIIDSYINVNGTVYFGLIIELEILRFDKTFILTLFFREYNDEFFGSVEIEGDLEKLTNDI